MPYTIYDTEALVVGRQNYKEASSRLELYTKGLGRLSASAQAVRKVDAKLKLGLQVFSQNTTALVYGKSGWRIVGVIPDTNFFFRNPGKRAITIRTVRLLRQLVPGQQPDKKLYSIVANGLTALTENSQKVNDLIEQLMVFRMLARLGYAPDGETTELEPFTESAEYGEKVLEKFKPESDLAVEQINRSFKTLQL